MNTKIGFNDTEFLKLFKVLSTGSIPVVNLISVAKKEIKFRISNSSEASLQRDV